MNTENQPGYTARIRFRVPGRDGIGCDEPELDLSPPNGPCIALRSLDTLPCGGFVSIKKSEWLVLESLGLASAADAKNMTVLLMDALRRSFANCHMGADLGERTPKAGAFHGFIDQCSQVAEQEVVNDVHGPMIFSSVPRPKLVRVGEISAYRTIAPNAWKGAFAKACGSKEAMTNEERVAFELYTCAHAASRVQEAHFALLFATLEVLLEPIDRSASARRHVDLMIRATETNVDLEPDEKSSLIGTMEWMRRHSIRQSGRRFLEKRLPGWTHEGKTATDWFFRCYEIRNRLLHGNHPVPTPNELSQPAGALRLMLGNVLAGPVADE